jgi:hypothetical protein
VYEPNWSGPEFFQAAGIRTDMARAGEAPYLRPWMRTAGGEATLDVYCPYVLVDGTLSGEWVASEADKPTVEIRALQAKTRSPAEPDRWSGWQALHSGPGKFRVALAGIHGVYRFQVRLTLGPNAERKGEAGVKSLRVEANFETSITSIPRLLPGKNVIRFKVRDASRIRGPIRVVYRYQTEKGTESHEQVLNPEDFKRNFATYTIDVPGLKRCDSLVISY